MVKRLFLARHGESLANQQKLISGQNDTPLTDKGRQQAECLCDVLKQEKLSAIYASTLGRALATAHPTADYHRLKVQPLDALKEFNFGSWQGKASGDVASSSRVSWQSVKSGQPITGNEDFSLFQQRVLGCLSRLLDSGTNSVLVVGHRNTNEMILATLLGINPAERSINVKNKYLYEITFSRIPSIQTIRLGGEFHGKKFSGLKDD